MLNDTKRNQQFQCAIEQVIAEFTAAQGVPPHVLDVGTGCGLLAMMSAQAGAGFVTACEQDADLYEVAVQVVSSNHLSHAINTIPLNSSDIRCDQLPTKADIVVAEIVDAELIGEGILHSLRDVRRRLAAPNAIIIPARGRVFVELISCASVEASVAIPKHDGLPTMARTEGVEACRGNGRAKLTVRTTALEYTSLSAPLEVAAFSFAEVMPEAVRTTQHVVGVTNNGVCNSVLFWWELDLTDDGSISLSSRDDATWQDHWPQLVFSLPTPREVVRGTDATLHVSHDDFSFQFDLQQLDINKKECQCGLHIIHSARRLRTMNHSVHAKAYHRAIERFMQQATDPVTALDLCDGSWLGITAAQLGADRVVCVEDGALSRLVYALVAEANGADNCRFPANLASVADDYLQRLDLIVGDVFFNTMQTLPVWQCCAFWYRLTGLRKRSPGCFPTVIPARGTIMCAPATSHNLWHAACPVEVPGFQLDAMQEVQRKWYGKDHTYPLNMYDLALLADPVPLLTCDFYLNFSGSIAQDTEATIICPGIVHCMVVWVEYALGNDDEKICTGPQCEAFSQTVRFFSAPWHAKAGNTVKCRATLGGDVGVPEFQFELVSCGDAARDPALHADVPRQTVRTQSRAF